MKKQLLLLLIIPMGMTGCATGNSPISQAIAQRLAENVLGQPSMMVSGPSQPQATPAFQAFYGRSK